MIDRQNIRERKTSLEVLQEFDFEEPKTKIDQISDFIGKVKDKFAKNDVASENPSSLANIGELQEFDFVGMPRLFRELDHRRRDSVLTRNVMNDHYSVWGFINLLYLILFLSQVREIFRNYRTYGFLYKTVLYFVFNLICLNFFDLPVLFLVFVSFSFWVFICFLTERFLSGRISEKIIFLIHFVNVTSFFFYVVWIMINIDITPLVGFIFEVIFLCAFFKMISYAHFNYYYRKKIYASKSYPRNVNLRNIFYFMFVPTLTYCDSFPRAKKRDYKFLARTVMEFVFLVVLFTFMISQYILPLVQNTVKPINEMDFVEIIERVVRLSIPSILMFCIWFYLVFHCILNILAEIMMYGDRLFYLNWWDSTSFDEFWRRWNLPVHKFCLYHIYLPITKDFRFPKWVGNTVVFVVSAFFHELLLAIPFKSVKGLGFAVMLAQVPVIMITKRRTKGKLIGNYVFWLCWSVGFSQTCIWYYYDYIWRESQRKLKMDEVI